MARRTLLLAALALLALPASASATVPHLAVRVDQVGGRPVSFFTIKAHPGRRTRAGRIVVENRGRRRVVIDIDPVDALTASGLGSAYKLRALPRSGASRWTRLSTRALTIGPHGEAAVGVSVAVPRSAGPGDYLSGIGIEARGQRERPRSGSGLAVSSAQRYVLGLELRLPGLRHPLIELTGARVEHRPSGVTFLVGAHNSGNVILKDVEGEIRVNRDDGPEVLSEDVGPGTFVSGTSVDLSALAPEEQPKDGQRYRVRAKLRYGDRVAKLDEIVTFGKQQARSQEDYGGPHAGGPPRWLWALIAAAVVLALAAGARLARRRLRRPLSPTSAVDSLERELERMAESGAPLSVLVIVPATPVASDRAYLAERVRRRLRSGDRLADLGDLGLLVIAPETGERGVAGLGEDLERLLGDAPGGPPRLGMATTEEPVPAPVLIDRARPLPAPAAVPRP